MDESHPKVARKASRSRKRGRPTRGQEQAITDTIVRAALRLFLSHGYGATSMKRVGQEAGVSPGTLYARFPDKASLFAAAVERQVDIWKRSGPTTLARSSRKSLFHVIQAGALGQMELRDRPEVAAFGRLLALEAERFPELAQIYHDYALVIGFEKLTDAILETPEGRTMGRDKAAELALTVFEAVNGWAQMRIFLNGIGNSPAKRRKAARRIARIIAGSIADT